MKQVILILLAFISVQCLKAQDLTLVNRTTSNEHEHYGWALAMDETWLIVGSPHSETTAGKDAGKVIIYEKENGSWVEFQTLIDDEGNAFQNFGFSVGLSNGVLVVGAIGTFQEGPFSGQAMVYEYDGTTWNLITRIAASDAAPGAHFGHSVTTNGNIVAVSAIKADGNEEKSGAVYTYQKSGNDWSFQAKLIANDGATNDNFGYDIDMNGNGRLVVGAPNQGDLFVKSGAAYVFEPNESGYEESEQLKVLLRSEKDYMGTSVAISNNDIVVGAYLADGIENNAGLVYFFRLEDESWNMKQAIFNPSGKLNDYFGRNVDISPFRLIIGSPKINNGDDLDAGQSFYFEKEGQEWVLKQALSEPSPAANNYMGSAVAITDFDLATGSRLNDGLQNDGGAVYTSGLGEVLSNDEINLTKAISVTNYPNPTRSDVSIAYQLRKPSTVAVDLFDANGKPIKVLLEATLQSPGRQELTWDLTNNQGSRVSEGLYLYKLTIDGNVFTRKILVSY